jgi:hypothetical protein
MEPRFPKFVLPAPDVVWRPSIESGAGVYLLGTCMHFATIGSDCEASLAAAGAMRVGTLRFDSDLNERSHPLRSVRRVPAVAAIRAGSSRN